jgi:hypothetical protein
MAMETPRSVFGWCLFTICLVLVQLISGCATTWENHGSFTKAKQTELIVESVPESDVYLNGRIIGKSPCKTLLE